MGKIPDAPPVPKVPPLPPPKPMPVDETNTEVQASKRDLQKAELLKMGRGTSILAGALTPADSVTGSPKKSLLGG